MRIFTIEGTSDNRDTIQVMEDGTLVYTLRREDPTFTRWTARDVDEYMVDFDTFSNDLIERLSMLPPTSRFDRPVLQCNMVPNTALYEKLKVLVTMAHRDQSYGEYAYTHHIDMVERKVLESEHCSIIDRMITYGHDLLENCPHIVSQDEVCSYYGPNITKGIRALTRAKHQTYLEYLDAICREDLNIIAIKLADINCNYTECSKLKLGLTKRYENAQEILLSAIKRIVFGYRNKELDVTEAIDVAFEWGNKNKTPTGAIRRTAEQIMGALTHDNKPMMDVDLTRVSYDPNGDTVDGEYRNVEDELRRAGLVEVKMASDV
jgi:hypothetical protein